MAEKVKTHFFEILGFIIGIAGIIVTVVGASVGTNTPMLHMYCVLLVSETMLGIIWGLNLTIKYSYQEKKKRCSII